MTAVALGYGRFHSAYLARAMAAADAAGVNPFRLIVALGRRDMMRLSDELLSETIHELEGQRPPELRSDVARFDDPRFGPRRIGNRPTALGELVDSLEVVAAKRHLDVVVDLVQTSALDEEAVTAAFVLEDDDMALGRVRFGSLDAAAAALDGVGERVALGLYDVAAAGSPSVGHATRALEAVLPHGIVAYRSTELELQYLADTVLALAAAGVGDRVVVADGTHRREDVDRFVAQLSASLPVERGDRGATGAIVAVPGPGTPDERPGGGSWVFFGDAGSGTDAGPAVVLRREDAYRGSLPRWRRAVDAARSARLAEIPAS
jgi:hypothetical protein